MRREDGKFGKICSCISHDHFSLFAPVNKRVPQKVIETTKRQKNYKLLLQINLTSKQARNVCSVCLEYMNNDKPLEDLAPIVESQESNATVEGNTEENRELLYTIQELKELLTSVNYEQISSDIRNGLKDLAGDLGRIISSDLFVEGQNIEKQYKDINELTKYDLKQWIKNQNPVLTEFLMACTEIKLDSTPNSKKLYALAHAIEQLLYGKNLKLITPFAFQRNLTVYSITNSKDVARLTGCWKNSGSYTTLSQIVTSPYPPIPCPNGDVHNTTDNNQKVGCTSGRIKEESKVPTSICTTVCHITPQPTTTFQEVDLLMPLKWLDMTKLEEILVKVKLWYIQQKLSFVNTEADILMKRYLWLLMSNLKQGMRVFLIMSILLLLIKGLFTHVLSVVILMKKLKLVAHRVKMTLIIMVMAMIHIFEQNRNTLRKNHLFILGNLAWSIQTLLKHLVKL